MTIKTRFAPSPTGLMHLGNARTALFNALYAYQHQGIFLLRIEDTDLERSCPTFAQHILDDLRWLGLHWQEGPEVSAINSHYYQSQRTSIYAEYYQQLEQLGQVYPCFCSPEELDLSRKLQRTAGQAPRYSGTCAHLSPQEISHKLAQGLQPSLRFKVPKQQLVTFTDVVRGSQTFNTNDIGDFIIRRADHTPAFFFCNAIDDALMGITHVLRGEDHLANTPRQLLILQALNLPIPNYGHIALILSEDGNPLSKRMGSQNLQDLKTQGWLPEGLVNYLARLGHSYQADSYFNLAELSQRFALERLGKAPARFDPQQMQHWQQMAIAKIDETELWAWMGNEVQKLVPTALQTQFITAIRPNVTTPDQASHWARILFTDDLVPQPEAQLILTDTDPEFFKQVLAALEVAQADYTQLVTTLKQTSKRKGKALFMPLRAALTGETHGPEMTHLLPLLGVQRAQHRLQIYVQ